MHAIALYRGVIPYRDLMFKKALLILLICSPIHSYSSDMNCENFHFGELCRVSIINLIASPEKYDGKFVEVDGYYRYEFEVSGLFLTQEHSTASSFSNSIWISFGDIELDHFNCKLPENAELCNQLHQPKDASGQFVGVIGKFSKSDRGHRGIFQGSINQVQGFFKK